MREVGRIAVLGGGPAGGAAARARARGAAAWGASRAGGRGGGGSVGGTGRRGARGGERRAGRHAARPARGAAGARLPLPGGLLRLDLSAPGRRLGGHRLLAAGAGGRRGAAVSR